MLKPPHHQVRLHKTLPAYPGRDWADRLRLSRIGRIGPITFFHLPERYAWPLPFGEDLTWLSKLELAGKAQADVAGTTSRAV
ncbi:MAG: hypothetical protein QM773_12380 [Hyphomonadaceae bacterium]